MNEKKIKHLEFIQNAINRMSTNSFIIKGWCITIISAVYALSDKESDRNFSFISYILIPIFWYLNSYFLQLERKFRLLYDKVRMLDESNIDFTMDINKSEFKTKKTNLFTCFFSKSLWPLYVILIILNILILKIMI